jgi:1-acyl-sn-glycerol-3-phosphate acyltransferase
MTSKAPVANYVDPLHPYTVADTLLNGVLWPVSAVHMVGWLGAFLALDKTLWSGGRFDKLSRFVSRRVTDLIGIRITRSGLENVDPQQAYVICPNHVSLLDTPVLVGSIPVYSRSFQDLAQFKIPIYGDFVRVMGQLPVQRGNKELNRQSYAEASEMLRSGDSFVVFPEGHRTRDGKLGKFYPGAFRLAIEGGVPVLPVVTKGLRNLCPAGEWRLRPGNVEVIFGAPISTDGLQASDVDALAERVRAAMIELLDG